MKTTIMKLCRLTALLSLTLITALASAQAGNDQAANPNRMVVPLSHPSQPARIKLHRSSGNISVHGTLETRSSSRAQESARSNPMYRRRHGA